MSEFEPDTFLDMPDDGDDDMPPLVDRPPPTMAMMTYSFDSDFTPIPYSPDAPDFEMAAEQAPRFELVSEEDIPRISATKTSHAKKREAGHIPRPPNAFILFRSSFIKSESVPGNIEGNHSTLSKIIGIVWKTLPPAERELWEKRAVQAQAEHRARYPDWRFRPGTNVDALAKRKTKDKNKDRPPARRRRSTASTRDKIAGGTGGGGGGGRVRGKERGGMQERRCAQIAELLARGVKGVALTSAVQAWDKESGASPGTDGVFVAEPGVAAAKAARVRARAKTDSQVTPVLDDYRGRSEMRAAKDAEAASIKTRSVSSAQQARFNVSLTAMFRRASSVPLAPAHDSPVQSTGVWALGNAQDSFVSSVPELTPPPLSPASSVSYCSEVSFPDSDNSSISPLYDFVSFSPPGSPCSTNMDNNDSCSLGPAAALGLGPADPAPELPNFFSSYSTLCDWAGAGTAAADSLYFNNGCTKVGLPSIPYGFPGDPDMIDYYPFSFLLHGATATPSDSWGNGLGAQELLAVRPGPAFGFEGAWAGPGHVATAAPYA
ncbi:hypothetical protein EDB87DRAFT_1577813 [Lactarius vividus]|nr:hypothetical protein EDB87DRAFT_1577813 [Lactarius vividus]